eukprot:5487022-Prymnesium_polylepis.1
MDRVCATLGVTRDVLGKLTTLDIRPLRLNGGNLDVLQSMASCGYFENVSTIKVELNDIALEEFEEHMSIHTCRAANWPNLKAEYLVGEDKSEDEEDAQEDGEEAEGEEEEEEEEEEETCAPAGMAGVAAEVVAHAAVVAAVVADGLPQVVEGAEAMDESGADGVATLDISQPCPV